MSEQPEQPADPARPREVPIEGAPGWVIDQRKGLFADGATFNEKVIGYQENIHLPPPPPPMPLDQALALLAELPLDEVPSPQMLPTPQRMRSWVPNPLFVGRDNDLGQIAAQLKAGGTIAVSTGIGGVGKTQLAIEAAHRYGRYFGGGVFWLSFADPASIPTEIADCGRAIGAFHEAEQLDLDAQVQRTLARWASELPRLLIFDNCEDEAFLRRWRPVSGGCRVLVTSRKQTAWSPDLRVTLLPLDVLPRPASVQLLQRLAPRLTAKEASQIAEELGDLPLALHLAGHYLALYHGLAVESYLAKLRSPDLLKHRSLIGHGVQGMPTEREPHVARAFALSFDHLDQDDPADVLACQFLARAAYFAPGEPFAQNWLEATMEVAGDEEDQEIARTDALNRLLGLGLLEQEGGGLRLHRLLAAFTENALTDDDALPAVEQVVNRVAYLANETKVPRAMMPVLSHLRHLVQKAEGREDELVERLYSNLGYYLKAVGAFEEALPLYERALAISERMLGSEHPLTASNLNNLARLLEAQGTYERALPLLERALAIRERVLGSEHPDTAQSLNNLAALHYAQGVYKRALPLYERALAIMERVRGAEHADTISSLNNLAELYRVQGAYERAQPLFERALAISEKVQGADHPDTAGSLNNLAELYRAQGAYERALPLHERALAVRERVLGASHPDTAGSLNNLAELYRSQGTYELAQPLCERAVTIFEQVLGAEHPLTATSMNNLAKLYRAQGAYERALLLCERALDIRERMLGVDHFNTATSLNDLATLHHEQGAYDRALPLYKRAQAICERVLGADHPDIATILNNLAMLHAGQGAFAHSISLLERAITIWQMRLGPQHSITVQAERNLAVLRQYEAVRIGLQPKEIVRLSPEEAQSVAARLMQVPGASNPLEQLAPLLQAIVTVALGDEGPRAFVELDLAQLEAQGLYLISAVQALWTGQRNEFILTLGLGPIESQLIQTVLQMVVQQERLAHLPEAVRGAVESQDRDALQQAIAELPPEEAQRVVAQLMQVAGVSDPFAQFNPFLQAIAAVALGNNTRRAEVEAVLAQLEQRDYHLTNAVQAIWNGQRDIATLTAGLDDTDTALIGRVLALLVEAD